MNKRIKELKDQCYIPIIDRVGDSEYDMEKFAELIVRECAEIAGCNGHVSGFSLGDLIKERFGVQ